MVRINSAAVILVGVVFSNIAMATPLSAIDKNRNALKALENKEPSTAESSLISALGDDPFNPLLHLNLGLVFEVEEKYDKALKEAESVLRNENTDPEIQFYAHFNAGNAAAKKGSPKGDDSESEGQDPDAIKLALKHYQAALDLVPDSKEVKTNIELLLKSGQGKGKGSKSGSKGKDDKDSKPDNKGQNKPDPQKDNIVNGRKQKPTFNSDSLTKEDVRKILDEIQAQEQHIRALDYANKNKDSPPAKDW